MASGSQVCKPNWADFPTTPKNKKKEIRSASAKCHPKSNTESTNKKGARAKTAKKSTVPKNKKSRKIPTARPQSPTLLTTIALKADLLACALVNQKFISK